MKAKDIIKELEAFDPEEELMVKIGEVSLAGHLYEHLDHQPKFIKVSE